MATKYIYRINSIDANKVIHINFMSARYKSVAASNFEKMYPSRRIYTNLNQDIEGIKRVSQKEFTHFFNKVVAEPTKMQRELWEKEHKQKLQQFAINNAEKLKELEKLGITFNPF